MKGLPPSASPVQLRLPTRSSAHSTTTYSPQATVGLHTWRHAQDQSLEDCEDCLAALPCEPISADLFGALKDPQIPRVPTRATHTVNRSTHLKWLNVFCFGGHREVVPSLAPTTARHPVLPSWLSLPMHTFAAIQSVAIAVVIRCTLSSIRCTLRSIMAWMPLE